MFICPVPIREYKITQGVGENPQDYDEYGLSGHNGLDFAPRPKTRQLIARAPHSGYCHIVNQGDVGYGLHVVILSEPYNKEGMRFQSTLAHLASVLVKEGQYVGTSDEIGVVGSTGNSSGVHLHWTPRRTDREGNVMDYNNGLKGVIKNVRDITLPLILAPI